MPRKAYLAQHYSSEELKKKYLKSKDSVESRKWHLLWKISLGWTIKHSAIAVGISYNYAQEILREYNKSGAKALKNGHKNPQKRSRGKKPLLSKEQIEKLKQELESSPSPEDGIWTGPKVARWIEKETGRKKVWNQRGWDYLKKCRYSWQSPRPSHKKGDKLEQEIFKANLPLVVKKLEQENPGAEVDTWFFAEAQSRVKTDLKKGLVKARD